MKIVTLEDITKIREGKILVTTNGTFDVLHIGHVRILQEAKSFGDVLLVLVNSDASVKMNKGPTRPIIPESERMEMLAALSCVDYVLKFDEKEVTSLLEKIKPDVHLKGGTFLPERVQAEKSLVESWNGKHVCLEPIGNYSTTNILEKISSLGKGKKLEGKVALITGASRGIGRAIALAFAREGAKVGIHFNSSQQDAEEILAEVNKLSSGILIAADISTLKDFTSLVSPLLDSYGRIDILVNNAGYYGQHAFLGARLSEWDATMNVNLRAPYFLSEAVAQVMLQQSSGVIINIASDAAFQAKKDSGIDYGISKAGLVYFTESLAVTLAPHIRVNALAPGYTLTDKYKDKKEMIENGNPLKKMNTPKDIAEIALFLASEKSKNITGQTFLIDNGRSLV